MKKSPTIEKHLAKLIAEGATYANACEIVGIDYGTLRRWMISDCKFCNAIKKAEAQGIHERVKRIAAAGRAGNWQADAWYLERRRPQDWGRNTTLAPEQLMMMALETLGRTIKGNPEAQRLFLALQDEVSKTPTQVVAGEKKLTLTRPAGT